MSLYKKALLSAALIFGIAATTFAQMRLDLDQKPGDQRLREAKIKPGEKTKGVQLLGYFGIKLGDIQEYEIELWFNPKKVTVKSFQPSVSSTPVTIGTPDGIMGDAEVLSMQTLKPGNVQGRKRPGGVKLRVGYQNKSQRNRYGVSSECLQQCVPRG